MQLVTKEHHDLMEHFESQYKERPKREEKRFWPMGHLYCNGEINKRFIAYREGYAFAKHLYQRRSS